MSSPPLPYAPPLPGLSIRTGSSSEESLTEENQAPLWADEELADRRTSFAQDPATTADRLDAM